MAENVVKLTASKRLLDLRGDNRLPTLLDDRDRLKAQLNDIQKQLKEIDGELKDKLGDAEQLVTDGWKVSQSTYIRKAYTVPQSTISRIYVSRSGRRRIHKSIED